jgi:hypothetical protein
LLTPDIGGRTYEVWYRWPYRTAAESAPFAMLDVDRTLGFGPETVTIGRFFPGTYRYFVHNFKEEQGNTGELVDSKAVVQIYSDRGLLRTVSVPTEGAGDYWEVCAIDGATGGITLINRIVAAKPTGLAQAPPEAPASHPGIAAAGVTGQYLWQFGDGTSSTDKNPAKTYAQPGVYAVSLQVLTSDRRTGTAFKPGFIVVTGEPAAGPPALSLVRAGGQAWIRWVAAEPGYVLEAKGDLNAVNWLEVTAAPTAAGSNNFNLNLPDVGNQYFRLRK